MENLKRGKFRQAILSGVEEVLDKAEDQYDSVSEKASDVFSGVKKQASNAYENVKEKAAQTKEKTDQYVRENPEKSLLMAAGIGALAGLIAAGLMMKKKKS